jgi:hypothetical protein
MIGRYVRQDRDFVAASLAAAMVVITLASLSPVSGNAQQPAVPRPVSRFVQPEPVNFDDHVGWTQIFDGKSLAGWDGPPDVWSYEDGAIVGKSSPEHPSGTTNIIWKGGEPANFILKLEMKLEGTGANGGIQYRSHLHPPTMRTPPADATDEVKKRILEGQALVQRHAKWNMTGYQADFDYNNRYTGQLYEQDSPRGIVAWRGQVVATEHDKKPTLLATLEDADALKGFIKPGEWNQVEIIADGNVLTHIVNGHVMSVLVDSDPTYAQAKGLIALEIEGGGILKISHRNIWLKPLP